MEALAFGVGGGVVARLLVEALAKDEALGGGRRRMVRLRVGGLLLWLISID